VARRRLVAVAALAVVVAIVLTVALLDRSSGDAFTGTWSATGAGGRVVITHVSGTDYAVVIGAGHKSRPAVRSGDRLTVAAAPGATPGVIVLKPGPDSGTLDESFPDGTSNVLTRGR